MPQPVAWDFDHSRELRPALPGAGRRLTLGLGALVNVER